MRRVFKCTKCGEDISESYQGDDPDVGITAGWSCDRCGLGFRDDDYGSWGPDDQEVGED